MVLLSLAFSPEPVRQEYWVGSLLYVGNYVYCEPKKAEVGYLLFGGMLLGDTFHAIPLLNWLTGERGRARIIWWSGTYERAAVEFLKNFYPIEARYFKDQVPWEIKDRDRFIDAHLPRLMEVLKTVPWETAHFDSKGNRTFDLQNLKRWQAAPGDFMVVHPASRHSWKNIPAIHSLDWRQFGMPVVTVGAPGEFLIPGSLDFRGRPLFEVARVIASARLFVGIHSSMSCLSLYLDRPAVVCAPAADPAYVKFGELGARILDLVQPTGEDLIKAVSSCLEKSDKRALTSPLPGGRPQAGSPAPILRGTQDPVGLPPLGPQTTKWRKPSWAIKLCSKMCSFVRRG